MNTDSLGKLVELLQSRRVVGAVLIGGPLAVGLWHLAGEWLSATLSPVRPEAGFILVFLVCYAAASLLIDGATSTFRRASSSLQERRAAQKRTAESEQLRLRARQKVREILPHLPADHIATLRKLLAGPEELYSRGNITVDLVSLRAIQEIQALSGNNHLYRLHPEVEADIKRHFWKEAEEKASKYVEDAGELELEFLRLFGEEDPPDPAAPRHPKLRPGISFAIQQLLGCGVLVHQETKRPRHSAVRLADEAVEVVEKAIGCKVARRVIELDPSRILVDMQPGGGVRSGWS